jgi:phosphoglucomutase
MHNPTNQREVDQRPGQQSPDWRVTTTRIYAESFNDEKHLQAIVAEAQRIVSTALAHDA